MFYCKRRCIHLELYTTISAMSRSGNNNNDKSPVQIKLPSKKFVAPDGGWGWMCVLGCFTLHLLLIGMFKSFGVFFVEFLEVFQAGSSATAWVSSICVATNLILGPLSSMLSNMFTCRKVVFVGGIIVCLGMTLSMFANSIKYLYMSYGLVSGIGASLAYGPSIIIVGRYFDKHRALANGLSVAGSGVGTFILPMVIRLLLQEYGFQGALLIMGGLLLNICVVASLYRPLKFPTKSPSLCNSFRRKVIEDFEPEINSIKSDINEKTSSATNPLSGTKFVHTAEELTGYRLPKTPRKYCTSYPPALISEHTEASTALVPIEKYPSVVSRVCIGSEVRICIPAESGSDRKIIKKIPPYLRSISTESRISVSSNLYLSNGYLTCASLQNLPKYSADESKEIEEVPTSVRWLQNSFRLKKFPQKWRQKDEGVPLFEFRLLKNSTFMLYVFSVMFATSGSNNMFLIIPAHARDNEIDHTKAALLISITGIMDLIGRVFFGWFSDLHIIQRRHGFVFCMAFAGLTCFVITAFKSFTGLAVCCAVFGFFCGSYVALIAVRCVDILGVEKMASAFGLTIMFQGFSVLFAPPVVGFLRDSTGSYQASFYFMGSSMIFGAVLSGCENLAAKYCEEKKKKTDPTPQPEEKYLMDATPPSPDDHLEMEKSCSFESNIIAEVSEAQEVSLDSEDKIESFAVDSGMDTAEDSHSITMSTNSHNPSVEDMSSETIDVYPTTKKLIISELEHLDGTVKSVSV